MDIVIDPRGLKEPSECYALFPSLESVVAQGVISGPAKECLDRARESRERVRIIILLPSMEEEGVRPLLRARDSIRAYCRPKAEAKIYAIFPEQKVRVSEECVAATVSSFTGWVMGTFIYWNEAFELLLSDDAHAECYRLIPGSQDLD